VQKLLSRRFAATAGTGPTKTRARDAHRQGHRRATPGRADLSIEDAFEVDFGVMMRDFTQPASDPIEESRAAMSPDALKALKGFVLMALGPKP
jgi:hypothetical protein